MIEFLKKYSIKIFWKILKVFLPKKSILRTFSGEFFSNSYLLKLNIRQIIWCYLNGFLPKEYFVYNLSCNDYRKYLPQLNNIRKASINGQFGHVLGNKIMFERQIKSVIENIGHLNVIDNIGYIDDSTLKSFHKDLKTGNFNSLIDFLEKKDLILKPISGSKGSGVLLLQKKDQNYLLNNIEMNWAEIVVKLSSLNDYLIQERFVQVGFSHDIYPVSLNTIRICTMIDPENNQPFIAYAIHRFGSQDSGYTDNFSTGGISARIGLDGKLSKGKSVDKEGKIHTFEFHPLSNKRIFNEQIPAWENITWSLLEMIRRMPYLKHVGWDVIFSNGEIYILECNIGPGVNLIQIHQPLSEITQAWKFYKVYGFIDSD